ncbi:hypothetical protein BOX15_Mlig002856g1 [Macrostomum lignano]|uniref:Alpha-tubulin N-acetyltransferase n=1 Tax=Macrostomum lignano TaxID=282301 RepID=A0A267F5F6_9PLAT|nr:hypothetical protein BOX15_Mlig002856g1 [Macrostomum lignano]
MEFTFNINPLLSDEITIIDSSFSNLQKFQRSSYDSHRNNLMQVIDNMGIASGKAQALPNAITSFKRLQYSDHRLYVLKDAFANNMQGAVVGILKMGRKKLFVYDMLGKQHEMEPLCVLDFYVHESRQRHGYGKVLFEYMLQQEQVEPVHLAIDRPSPKFAGFLKKHYGLKDCIPQMNNFVVFHGFFRDRPESGAVVRGRSGGRLGRPPAHPQSPTKRPPSATLGDRKSLLPSSRQTPRQAPSSARRQQQPGSAGRHSAGLPPPSPQPPPQQPQRTGGTPPVGGGGHSASPYRQEILPSDAELMEAAFAARRASPQHAGSLGRSPSLSRQQQRQQRQSPTEPVGLGVLPGLASYQQQQQQQLSRTRSNPNLANPTLYGGGGGGGGPELAMKSRYFPPAAYDYQQGLRRHYSHTRLW